MSRVRAKRNEVREVPGRDVIPPNRGELPVLPGTVAAAHLAACAAGLATDTAPDRVSACVGSLAELAELAEHLVTGQRQLARTLDQLAEHLRERPRSMQLMALVEVLRAAGQATGHAADALAESGPVINLVRDSTGE